MPLHAVGILLLFMVIIPRHGEADFAGSLFLSVLITPLVAVTENLLEAIKGWSKCFGLKFK